MTNLARKKPIVAAEQLLQAATFVNYYAITEKKGVSESFTECLLLTTIYQTTQEGKHPGFLRVISPDIKVIAGVNNSFISHHFTQFNLRSYC